MISEGIVYYFSLNISIKTNISNLFSGVELHDTCDNDDIVESHLYQLISATRGRSVTGPPLLGESTRSVWGCGRRVGYCGR